MMLHTILLGVNVDPLYSKAIFDRRNALVKEVTVSRFRPYLNVYKTLDEGGRNRLAYLGSKYIAQNGGILLEEKHREVLAAHKALIFSKLFPEPCFDTARLLDYLIGQKGFVNLFASSKFSFFDVWRFFFSCSWYYWSYFHNPYHFSRIASRNISIRSFIFDRVKLNLLSDSAIKRSFAWKSLRYARLYSSARQMHLDTLRYNGLPQSDLVTFARSKFPRIMHRPYLPFLATFNFDTFISGCLKYHLLHFLDFQRIVGLPVTPKAVFSFLDGHTNSSTLVSNYRRALFSSRYLAMLVQYQKSYYKENEINRLIIIHYLKEGDTDSLLKLLKSKENVHPLRQLQETVLHTFLLNRYRPLQNILELTFNTIRRSVNPNTRTTGCFSPLLRSRPLGNFLTDSYDGGFIGRRRLLFNYRPSNHDFYNFSHYKTKYADKKWPRSFTKINLDVLLGSFPVALSLHKKAGECGYLAEAAVVYQRLAILEASSDFLHMSNLKGVLKKKGEGTTEDFPSSNILGKTVSARWDFSIRQYVGTSYSIMQQQLRRNSGKTLSRYPLFTFHRPLTGGLSLEHSPIYRLFSYNRSAYLSPSFLSSNFQWFSRHQSLEKWYLNYLFEILGSMPAGSVGGDFGRTTKFAEYFSRNFKQYPSKDHFLRANRELVRFQDFTCYNDWINFSTTHYRQRFHRKAIKKKGATFNPLYSRYVIGKVRLYWALFDSTLGINYPSTQYSYEHMERPSFSKSSRSHYFFTGYLKGLVYHNFIFNYYLGNMVCDFKFYKRAGWSKINDLSSFPSKDSMYGGATNTMGYFFMKFYGSMGKQSSTDIEAAKRSLASLRFTTGNLDNVFDELFSFNYPFDSRLFPILWKRLAPVSAKHFFYKDPVIFSSIISMLEKELDFTAGKDVLKHIVSEFHNISRNTFSEGDYDFVNRAPLWGEFLINTYPFRVSSDRLRHFFFNFYCAQRSTKISQIFFVPVSQFRSFVHQLSNNPLNSFSLNKPHVIIIGNTVDDYIQISCHSLRKAIFRASVHDYPMAHYKATKNRKDTEAVRHDAIKNFIEFMYFANVHFISRRQVGSLLDILLFPKIFSFIWHLEVFSYLPRSAYTIDWKIRNYWNLAYFTAYLSKRYNDQFIVPGLIWEPDFGSQQFAKGHYKFFVKFFNSEVTNGALTNVYLKDRFVLKLPKLHYFSVHEMQFNSFYFQFLNKRLALIGMHRIMVFAEELKKDLTVPAYELRYDWWHNSYSGLFRVSISMSRLYGLFLYNFGLFNQLVGKSPFLKILGGLCPTNFLNMLNGSVAIKPFNQVMGTLFIEYRRLELQLKGNLLLGGLLPQKSLYNSNKYFSKNLGLRHLEQPRGFFSYSLFSFDMFYAHFPLFRYLISEDNTYLFSLKALANLGVSHVVVYYHNNEFFEIHPRFLKFNDLPFFLFKKIFPAIRTLQEVLNAFLVLKFFFATGEANLNYLSTLVGIGVDPFGFNLVTSSSPDGDSILFSKRLSSQLYNVKTLVRRTRSRFTTGMPNGYTSVLGKVRNLCRSSRENFIKLYNSSRYHYQSLPALHKRRLYSGKGHSDYDVSTLTMYFDAHRSPGHPRIFNPDTFIGKVLRASGHLSTVDYTLFKKEVFTPWPLILSIALEDCCPNFKIYSVDKLKEKGVKYVIMGLDESLGMEFRMLEPANSWSGRRRHPLVEKNFIFEGGIFQMVGGRRNKLKDKNRNNEERGMRDFYRILMCMPKDLNKYLGGTRKSDVLSRDLTSIWFGDYLRAFTVNGVYAYKIHHKMGVPNMFYFQKYISSLAACYKYKYLSTLYFHYLPVYSNLIFVSFTLLEGKAVGSFFNNLKDYRARSVGFLNNYFSPALVSPEVYSCNSTILTYFYFNFKDLYRVHNYTPLGSFIYSQLLTNLGFININIPDYNYLFSNNEAFFTGNLWVKYALSCPQKLLENETADQIKHALSSFSKILYTFRLSYIDNLGSHFKLMIYGSTMYEKGAHKYRQSLLGKNSKHTAGLAFSDDRLGLDSIRQSIKRPHSGRKTSTVSSYRNHNASYVIGHEFWVNFLGPNPILRYFVENEPIKDLLIPAWSRVLWWWHRPGPDGQFKTRVFKKQGDGKHGDGMGLPWFRRVGYNINLIWNSHYVIYDLKPWRAPWAHHFWDKKYPWFWPMQMRKFYRQPAGWRQRWLHGFPWDRQNISHRYIWKIYDSTNPWPTNMVPYYFAKGARSIYANSISGPWKNRYDCWWGMHRHRYLRYGLHDTVADWTRYAGDVHYQQLKRMGEAFRHYTDRPYPTRSWSVWGDRMTHYINPSVRYRMQPTDKGFNILYHHPTGERPPLMGHLSDWALWSRKFKFKYGLKGSYGGYGMLPSTLGAHYDYLAVGRKAESVNMARWKYMTFNRIMETGSMQPLIVEPDAFMIRHTDASTLNSKDARLRTKALAYQGPSLSFNAVHNWGYRMHYVHERYEYFKQLKNLRMQLWVKLRDWYGRRVGYQMRQKLYLQRMPKIFKKRYNQSNALFLSRELLSCAIGIPVWTPWISSLNYYLQLLDLPINNLFRHGPFEAHSAIKGVLEDVVLFNLSYNSQYQNKRRMKEYLIHHKRLYYFSNRFEGNLTLLDSCFKDFHYKTTSLLKNSRMFSLKHSRVDRGDIQPSKGVPVRFHRRYAQMYNRLLRWEEALGKLNYPKQHSLKVIYKEYNAGGRRYHNGPVEPGAISSNDLHPVEALHSSNSRKHHASQQPHYSRGSFYERTTNRGVPRDNYN